MDSFELHERMVQVQWQWHFAAHVLHSGEVLLAQHRLRSFEHKTSETGIDVIHATLQDDNRLITQQLDIELRDGRINLRPNCTCRGGERCKHLAAILTVLTEWPPQDWPTPVGVDWGRLLERLEQPVPGPTRAEPGRQLGVLIREAPAYSPVVTSTGGGGTVRSSPSRMLVAPVWLRPGKRGDRLVDPQGIAIGPLGPQPAPAEGWSPEVEAALILLLSEAVHRIGTIDLTWVHRANQERALMTLINTLPVYFERASDGPYRIGETQSLALCWRDQPDGDQRLALDVPHGRILLHGDRFWSVDVDRRVIEPFDTPAATVEALLQLPSLAPEQVDEFVERSRSVRLPLALPAPAARAAPTVLSDSPRPLIRLRELPAGSDWHRLAGRTEMPRVLGCARLRMVYGSIEIDPEEHSQQGRRLIGGTVYQVERDFAEEARALEVVKRLGLFKARSMIYELGLNDGSIQASDYLLKSGGTVPMSPDKWQPTVATLIEHGFTVEYEDDFPRDDLVEVGEWYADVDADGEGHAWFQLSLGIDIAGERIDLLPILRRLLADPQFPLRPESGESADAVWRIRLDAKRSIELPLARLRALIEPLLEWLQSDRGGRLRLHRSQAESVTGMTDLRWRGDERLRTLIDRRRLAVSTASDAPPGFAAVLRPYQREGLAWLDFLADTGLGGVLADDMGLGKTVQVLAHLLGEKQRGRLDRPALVVCPTSLVGNWRAEAERFAPDLRVLTIHGTGRADAYDAIADSDLVITTYPLLPRDRDRLVGQHFSLLVLDEAQAVKNARSQAAQVVRELTATRRLAMTGTPLENHLGELWAQFDAIEPGLLGGERQFNRLYRVPIEKRNDEPCRQRLNRRIAPLLLRRRKDDVLTDLPDKTEIVRRIDLEGDQRALYETLRLAQHERIRDAIHERGLAQSGIVVLDALLKLRQACCDPGLVKLDSARKVKASVKREALHELLEGLLAEGRRILLFSQFTEMLDLLQADLNQRRIAHLRLTGDTPSQQRAGIVRRFQNGEVPLFLISLKAGGVGLNLTAADTVIHYDPWWNPAVENQATDRAHRIGQDKAVFVYKLICAGTVEEKIQALQSRKSDLAQAVLEGGSSQRLRFDESDLEALFAPL